MAKTMQKKTAAKTSVAAAKKTAVKKVAVKNIVSTAKKSVVKTANPAVKKAMVNKTTSTVKKTAVKTTVKKTVTPVPVKKTAAKPVTPAPVTKATVKTAAPVAKKAVTNHKKEEILKKLRLSKTDKKYFHDLLIHARASFGQQVKFHSEDALATRKDSAGERAGMATHMADLGTDNYRHDFELGLMSEEVDVLEMIDEALQRLEDSEYGICLDCGEQIPRKRLEAKPYAKYCTKCKSKREELDDFTHRR